MCVIALKFAGSKLPKDEHLRNCENRNKDGIGIALYREGATDILIKKDFKDAEALIVWLKENVKQEDTCMIHFRYATHGLKDEGNRHPFPITKNKEMMRQVELVCQMATVHNGVISQYGNETKFSDTQQFVMDILAEDAVKNNIENPAVQKLISNYIEHDRLAVMLNNGKIWMWGDWENVEDIAYSNTSYETPKVTWVRETKNDWQDRPCNGTCDGCGKFLKVLMIEDVKHDNFWNLCKPCRKKYYKGKLELKTEESVNQFKEKDGYFGNKPDFMAEDQCENCFGWYEKAEIRNYYGTKLCVSCFQYFTNMITPDKDSKQKLVDIRYKSISDK